MADLDTSRLACSKLALAGRSHSLIDQLYLRAGRPRPTRAKAKCPFNKEVVPEIGGQPVPVVGRNDVSRVINHVADRGPSPSQPLKEDDASARHITRWSAFNRTLGKKGSSTAPADGRWPHDRTVIIAPWTLDDLWRAVAAAWGRVAALPTLQRDCSTIPPARSVGVATVYNRHSYLPEMRQAVEIWPRHLMELVRDHVK